MFLCLLDLREVRGLRPLQRPRSASAGALRGPPGGPELRDARGAAGGRRGADEAREASEELRLQGDLKRDSERKEIYRYIDEYDLCIYMIYSECFVVLEGERASQEVFCFKLEVCRFSFMFIHIT